MRHSNQLFCNEKDLQPVVFNMYSIQEHLPTEKQNGCGMKHVGFYGAREKVDGYEI